MAINTINIHCNVISGIQNSGMNSDNLYTFDLTEPPSYMKTFATINVIYQNVTKEKAK